MLTAALKMLQCDLGRLRAEETEYIISEKSDPQVILLRTHDIEQLVTPSAHTMPCKPFHARHAMKRQRNSVQLFAIRT